MIFSLALMLLQLPGVESLPGLPVDYIPTAGAQMTLEVHQTTTIIGRFIVLALLALGLLGSMVAPVAGWKATSFVILRSGIGIALFLQVGPTFYGHIMRLGHSGAQEIVSAQEQEAFDDSWALAGDVTALQEMSPSELESQPWFVRVAAAMMHSSPVSVITQMLIAAWANAAFLLSATFVSMLWRALVQIDFVVGPLCIAFGVIPNWGSRVTMAWVAATCQLSLWQVWIAICTLFINKADTFLMMNSPMSASIDALTGDATAIPNTYEAILVQLVSVFLMLGVPVMVGIFFPWGRASQMLAWGLMDGAKTVVNTTQSIVEAPMKVSKVADRFSSK